MLRSLFGRAAEDDADAEHFDHWQTTDLCWSAGAERRALARWQLWARRRGGEPARERDPVRVRALRGGAFARARRVSRALGRTRRSGRARRPGRPRRPGE